MSCFGCSRKYGLFCKEYGCPNCGFSYCAKCLKRPMLVPRHGKVLNVCLICYDKLSKTQLSEKIIEHETLTNSNMPVTAAGAGADAIDDDLFGNVAMPENLDEILQPTVQTNVAKEQNKNNLDDDAIMKRLKELKSENNLPTDDEIRIRLANLNDMKEKPLSNKDILISTDQRSNQEKTNDLLHQFLEETEMDQRLDAERNDAISDIERRLLALRGGDGGAASNAFSNPQNALSPDTNTPSDNEENDEQMVKKVMERYCKEAALANVNSSTNEGDLDGARSSGGNDLNELPWCTICNEDAVYRCIGCDGELFCIQCYRECHNDEEYRAHKKEKYSAK